MTLQLWSQVHLVVMAANHPGSLAPGSLTLKCSRQSESWQQVSGSAPSLTWKQVLLHSPVCLHSAYVCHHNIFLVYNSLRNKTMKTYAIATNISVFSCMVFLSMLGILGYLTFQGNAQGATSRDTSNRSGSCPEYPSCSPHMRR